MKTETRIGPGSGPHAGRLEELKEKKWKFVKWVSKRDMLKLPKELEKQK